MEDLPCFLETGDVLVVNDAASLPASLPVQLGNGDSDAGESGRGNLEIRLAGAGAAPGEWWVVLFGVGSWREATEHRVPPPILAAGDRVRLPGDAEARVEAVSPFSPRLLRLRFDRTGEALFDVFYRYGRPVQYSYQRTDLALWDVQTRYGARPWAVEMPSAGRPLTWDLLGALCRAGVVVARLTHAAGLSATGDPALDARLPLPERYEIPGQTVDAIAAARRDGRRVLAVGTTVVRALEGSAAQYDGFPVPGPGITDLVLGPGYRLRVIDGILTGIHEPGTSHFALLQAFASAPLLEEALHLADGRGFLQHEFGDSMLVLPGPYFSTPPRVRSRSRRSGSSRLSQGSWESSR
jgi:S-adenosylmethionine:tRNA ribosyltransferase-isomerase